MSVRISRFGHLVIVMVMKFSFLQICWRFICQKNLCKFFFARNQYFGWSGELNSGPKSSSRYNLVENWHFYCEIGTIFVVFLSESYLSIKYTRKWAYSMKMMVSKISGGILAHFQKSANCVFWRLSNFFKMFWFIYGLI